MILKSDKYRVRVLDKQNIAVEEIRKVKKGKGNEMEGRGVYRPCIVLPDHGAGMNHLLNLQIPRQVSTRLRTSKEVVGFVKEIRDNMRKLLNEVKA